MTAARRWTTPAGIKAAVRRRWDDGSLLRALAAGDPFPVIDLPVRGPRPTEVGDDLDAVRQWIADLERGARGYDVIYTEIGGRHVGRNRIPSRAIVSSYDMAWRLLGVGPDVDRFQRVAAIVDDEPVLRAWVAQNPLKALAVADDWTPVVAAYRWLERHRGSGRSVREISAPGVDTKFVERHRPLLAALLGVSAAAAPFASGLGLRTKPDLLRIRFDSGFLGLPGNVSEATFRAQELARAHAVLQAAVIVENEVTFLSVPVPHEGVVIWGKGFEVDRAGRLPWLEGVAVHYWGDLDTHGFAILNQLRAWLPRTRSFLMDRETLLAHQDRWGTEPRPTAASLPQLTEAEAALYADLVSDRYAASLRLEQERIDWAWAEQRFPWD